jgi:Uma2 family endonuclease
LVLHVPGRGTLTQEEVEESFMLLLEDDTEDALWMIMGSPQWDATSDFYQSLREYAERLHRPWFVTGMTPILYSWPNYHRKRQLAPDVFVAFAPDRPRSSFDSDVEGFPQFVLEVVSPESRYRDQTEKRTAYARLGAREYALFTPYVDDRPSDLAGYRRNATGGFEPWPKDDQGRLWSDALGLYLVAQGRTLRAATPEGHLLPTLREAEAEIERLRQEIEDLRRQVDTDASDQSE